MRRYFFVLATIVSLLFSCRKENENPSPIPPAKPKPDQVVLLKEIVIPNLPSPFYHFDYRPDKQISGVSFASGLNNYTLSYDGSRISEMKNNIVVNKDRLVYTYDNESRVILIQYIDSTGVVYRRSNFTYNGAQIIKIERERKSDAAFVNERNMFFTYHADGNLKEMRFQRAAMAGQTELNYTDFYEQYDNEINVDGFSLVHEEFFEHLILLPGIKLQQNNPTRVIRTGDGVNYTINYTYTFNNKKQPVTKKGDLLFTKGPDSGKRFQTNSLFSYYE